MSELTAQLRQGLPPPAGDTAVGALHTGQVPDARLDSLPHNLYKSIFKGAAHQPV